MNKTILVGRLTQEATTRTVGTGEVSETSIAVPRGKDEVDFFDIKAWDNKVIQAAHKGSMVFIDGYLRQEKWETQEGEKRSKLVVMVTRADYVPVGKPKDEAPTSEAETLIPEDEEIPF